MNSSIHDDGILVLDRPVSNNAYSLPKHHLAEVQRIAVLGQLSIEIIRTPFLIDTLVANYSFIFPEGIVTKEFPVWYINQLAQEETALHLTAERFVDRVISENRGALTVSGVMERVNLEFGNHPWSKLQNTISIKLKAYRNKGVLEDPSNHKQFVECSMCKNWFFTDFLGYQDRELFAKDPTLVFICPDHNADKVPSPRPEFYIRYGEPFIQWAKKGEKTGMAYNADRYAYHRMGYPNQSREDHVLGRKYFTPWYTAAQLTELGLDAAELIQKFEENKICAIQYAFDAHLPKSNKRSRASK